MVKHVLRDGSQVADITGYIVKMEYATPVYNLLATINQDPRKAHKRGTENEKKSNRLN